jgi:(2Fe-2S) ferredoxin
MSFYNKHIFFCQNRREGDERPCCANKGSADALDHAKARVRALGLAGPGQIRVNKSGCLDRCELGPVAVVYPEAVWYTYVDNQDIDEIVDSHLRDGKIVTRLLLDPQ